MQLHQQKLLKLTKAAEIAVPNKMEIHEKLRNFEIRLNDLMNSKLDNLTHRFNNSRNNNYLKNPLLKYKNKHETLNLLKLNADKSMNQLISIYLIIQIIF